MCWFRVSLLGVYRTLFCLVSIRAAEKWHLKPPGVVREGLPVAGVARRGDTIGAFTIAKKFFGLVITIFLCRLQKALINYHICYVLLDGSASSGLSGFRAFGQVQCS